MNDIAATNFGKQSSLSVLSVTSPFSTNYAFQHGFTIHEVNTPLLAIRFVTNLTLIMECTNMVIPGGCTMWHIPTGIHWVTCNIIETGHREYLCLLVFGQARCHSGFKQKTRCHHMLCFIFLHIPSWNQASKTSHWEGTIRWSCSFSRNGFRRYVPPSVYKWYEKVFMYSLADRGVRVFVLLNVDKTYYNMCAD